MAFAISCFVTGFMSGWVLREVHQHRVAGNALKTFMGAMEKAHRDHMKIDQKPIPTETRKAVKKSK